MKFDVRLTMLLALSVTLAACGSDNSTPAPVTEDAGVRVEHDTGEGPCFGCFDLQGECQDGKADDACGGGGVDCMPCTGVTVCTDDGVCREPPPCNPDTCDGCCNAVGDCVTGDSGMACGAGGQVCAGCRDGQTCQGGRCVFGCGPDNCAGCCDSTGACVAGDADVTCGRGGAACSDCQTAGQVCGGGACVSMGCSQSCAGCCDGDQCRPGNEVTACGVNGGACGQCLGAQQCTAGACVASSGATWALDIVSADIAGSKLDGSGWDSFGGLPDVFVLGYAQDPRDQEFYWGETRLIEETLSPSWDETIATGIPEEAVQAGLFFEIWDFDAFVDDDICIFDVPGDAMAMSGQVIETVCPYDEPTKLRWRLRPE